ncbi:centrosomal protein of 55 kDa-like isoform 2-T2 [Lycodopsis pacificus]
MLYCIYLPCDVCCVIEIMSPRYKRALKKKLKSELDVVVSSLRKENAFLKKTLVEFNRLVERLLSLETVGLVSCQQLTTKDEKALPSEQMSKKEGKQMDVDSASDEWASSNTAIQLKNDLSEALEKNKQWLEYDQRREAYVGATLARMLWLEKQLNEANQAHLQQHNEDHSDKMEKISQMQEHYERLLQKAKDELEVLREKFNMTQKWCVETEREVEELKQQLQTANMSRTSAPGDHHCSEDEEQWLSAETENLQDEEQWQTAETEDLQCRLDKEKRRSAHFELQSSLFQKFLLNHQRADQEKIADLERQIKISSQDLEDEKQNCSYLKKQMVRVLKNLQKPRDHATKQSKRAQQDRTSCEAASLSPRDTPTWSPPSSSLDESFLECPSCRAEYPASHYRELMSHLEICFH